MYSINPTFNSTCFCQLLYNSLINEPSIQFYFFKTKIKTTFDFNQSAINMTIKPIIFSGLGVLLLSFSACKHDQITNDINWDLYELAKDTEGYTWFKNSSAALPRSSGSGHSAPLLRTRFNEIATTQLDSLGRIKSGITFPEGSVIVKELLNADESLERYALLLKDSSSEYADANGWVWGYSYPDGTVAEKAENKGKSCIGCHSQTENIDYVLMNKFYP